MKPDLTIVRCYWDKCQHPATVKWHPSKKDASFLWVCEPHVDELSNIFEFNVVNGEYYTIEEFDFHCGTTDTLCGITKMMTECPCCKAKIVWTTKGDKTWPVGCPPEMPSI